MKNNENDEICKIKIRKIKIGVKFQKKKGYFFGQHSQVEKSPTAADINIATKMVNWDNKVTLDFYF